jgi:type III secretion protein T
LEALPDIEVTLIAMLWALPRFLGFILIFPSTASEAVPQTVRNGLALVCAAFVAPLIVPHLSELEGNLLQLSFIVAKEVAIGGIVGFSFGCLIWSFEALGSLIDFQTGQENSTVFNPLSQEQTSTFSRFLSLFAVVLFFTMGGLALVLSLLIFSFKWWPVQSFVPHALEMLAEIARLTIIGTFELFLRLALAMVMLVLLVDLFFGLANRYAQGLNIFQLSFPVKGIAALFCLSLIMPAGADLFTESMDKTFRLFRNMFETSSPNRR